MNTIVIMAAGLGSRFQGPKQLEKVGPQGQTLMDYSLKYAKQSGFSRALIVTREEIFDDIKKSTAGSPLPVTYVLQKMDDIPRPFTFLPERTRPWGTGHVLHLLKRYLEGPFALINADDYYDPIGFKLMNDHLNNIHQNPSKVAIVGFPLGNTLSPHGGVSRGICKVDKDGFLQEITERKQIKSDNGLITSDSNAVLTHDTPVSINFWGFTPGIFDKIHKEVVMFFKYAEKELEAELFIPDLINILLQKRAISVNVLRYDGMWLGITHPKDKQVVVEGLKNAAY